MNSTHETYLHRCLQLASLGTGYTAPNPMVGAVLVYDNRIIGEGYHEQYGGPHAEVNCLRSILKKDRHLIPDATLYVSLEPCAHFGKTPPCSDLIIENHIKKVVVGCRDPFELVNGKSIEKLQAQGVEVITGILEKECIELNRRFFIFHTEKRPYLVLKWAQSRDGKIGKFEDDQHPQSTPRLHISNTYTNRLVHQWRSQEMGIAVGTNTAMLDDPQLTNRLWPGKTPLRIVLDKSLRLPQELAVFNGQIPTLVFNHRKHSLSASNKNGDAFSGLQYYQIPTDTQTIKHLLDGLYELNIQSVLVEGGAQFLQSFIDEDYWDEIRVITNEELVVGAGKPAPQLPELYCLKTETVFTDTIRYYRNSSV